MHLLLTMKQKTRFENFGNTGIGYQSMNRRYIDISVSTKMPYRSISIINNKLLYYFLWSRRVENIFLLWL